MVFTEQDLYNLSALSRIDIKEDEKSKMLSDVQAILGYISEINEVEGISQEGDSLLLNVVREDIVTNFTGSNTETILSEAPESRNGYIKVGQVLK